MSPNYECGLFSKESFKGDFTWFTGHFEKYFLYKYPKNGLISSSSISHESFHCVLSGQCIAFNKNDKWLKILGRTVPLYGSVQTALFFPISSIIHHSHWKKYIVVIVHNESFHVICCWMGINAFLGYL